MPRTSKAAFVTASGQPPTIGGPPVPEPGDGQLLIKAKAREVCHTDVHAAAGDWPGRPGLPFTPGHEGIGRVVSMARGVQQAKESERIGVPWPIEACVPCGDCLTSRDNVGGSAGHGGCSANGSLAEYVVAPATYVACIYDGLGTVEAGPISRPGVMTYIEINVAGRNPGDWFVISDVGGLGHLAVQYTTATSSRVAAVGKIALEGRLGATATSAAFAHATAVVRRGGTRVLNGMSAGDVSISIVDVVFRHLTVRGSLVGTRAEMNETLAFPADGKVGADKWAATLDTVNDVYERMRTGKPA